MAGEMTDFTIELLSGTSAKVLEQVQFDGNVTITPGSLMASVDRENDYKAANTTYRFLLNFVNGVTHPAKIYINFTDDWTFYAENCTVWRGITAFNNSLFFISLNFALGEILCYKINGYQSYVVENFESVNKSERVEVTIPLISPYFSSGYLVEIASYDASRGGYIDITSLNVSITTICLH